MANFLLTLFSVLVLVCPNKAQAWSCILSSLLSSRHVFPYKSIASQQAHQHTAHGVAQSLCRTAGQDGATFKTSLHCSSPPPSTSSPSSCRNSGDSYTSTGFNINGTQPSRENPLGNPVYPGDTTVGSPDWSSYLTALYNASFVKLYNLAQPGGTIDDTIDPSPFGALSFRQQVAQLYLPKYANGKGGWTAADSIFMIWFGVNDVMLTNAKSNASAYIDALTESYVGQAEKVTPSSPPKGSREGNQPKYTQTALLLRRAQLHVPEYPRRRPCPLGAHQHHATCRQEHNHPQPETHPRGERASEAVYRKVQHSDADYDGRLPPAVPRCDGLALRYQYPIQPRS